MPTTFKISSEQQFADLTDSISSLVNKETAMRLYLELHRSYPEPYYVERRGTTLTIEEYISPRKIRDYRSNELCQLISLFFLDTEHLDNYFKSLPEKFRNLMILLLKQKYVSSATLKSKGYQDCIQEEKNGWRYETVCNINAHNVWFDSLMAYDYAGEWSYHQDTYFYLDERFSGILASVLLPREERMTFRAEAPVKEGLATFDAETEAFKAFDVLNGYIRQDALKFGAFKVTLASSFKVMKQMPIKDILDNNPDLGQKYNLGQILFPFINHSLSKKYNDYQSVARRVYALLNNSYFDETIAVLLPHVKGFKTRMLANYVTHSAIRLANEALLQSEGRWIDIRTLSYRTICGTSTISRSSFREFTLENSILEFRITPEDLTSEVERPLLQSFFAVLYGLGGVSVICTDNEEGVQISPFDRIRYVRLNNFGKYIVGLTDEYCPPETECDNLFELDDKRLVIRSLKSPNPYESLLLDTAVPIGGGRFVMSPESFLSKCKGKKDVEEKIKFFKDYVCKDVPAVWSDFFENIKKRCKPFNSEKTMFEILSVDPSDKDLLVLLSTDEVLKNIIVKAEGYRIMVPTSKYTIFGQRLKQFGYLI